MAIDPKWAWQPYGPSPENPWDLKKAGHLLRRAGFGATIAELRDAVAVGPDVTVAKLLKGQPESPEFAAISRQIRKAAAKDIAIARSWWLMRMLDGPHPLREKLTLFWHNHFATSNAKVNDPAYMLAQYDLMHRHALGRFPDLLQEMSRDPAMMVWLDTRDSKKGKPNENYARELMELFSLGIGNYTETDIREAAKAFTGWEVRHRQAFFNVSEHDRGDKTVLGRKGKWKGDDIVRICLDQPACPRFVARKLFRFLVSETLEPSNELLNPLAEAFRAGGFDFGKLVETVLRSNLFYSPEAYRGRIKSPVDFALSTVRALELRVNLNAVADALETLGQNLFHPPSVKGWDGGPTWLNGQTLLFRQNLALALCSADGNTVRKPTPDTVTDPAELVAKHAKNGQNDPVAFLLELLLQGDVPPATRQQLSEYATKAKAQKRPAYWSPQETAHHPIRALAHLVLTLPEYQLD